MTEVTKSRRMRGWVQDAACMRAMRHVYKTLPRKPEGKRPLGRPRHKQACNIKIYLKERNGM
jgi:hypothetical protein